MRVTEVTAGVLLGEPMTYLFLTRWPPYPPLIGADIAYARELMTSLAEHRPVYALAFERPDVRISPRPNISWGLRSRRGGGVSYRRQMLLEHSASLSAASHPNRSRRLIKCAKGSGHYWFT